MTEQDDERGFTVSDRRGVAREAKVPPRSAPASADVVNDPSTTQAGDTPHGSAPPVDLSSLFLSLASSAMVYLGAPTPDGPPGPTDLPRAQEMIDLLALLELKTTGNRSAEETALLSNLLYSLRLRFVEHSR